jgi:ureidoacrylate peracid hydrolase
MGTKGNNDVLAHIIHYRPLIMTDDNINVVQGSPHSLPSDDVDFPDIFLPTASEAPSTLQKDFVPREKTNTASQSDETMNTESSNSVGNETTMTGGPVSAQQEQEVRPLPLSLQTSLKEHVKPGETKRDQFPLVPSKVALLIIDIQEYLSSPSSVQDEQGHAYFYQTSLPRATQNIQELVQQTRRRRDSQAQGCEVIFTYLEALTQDCRDVSLDYKLSGPSLANIPNSASSPATFLECIAPLHDGKGDIVIPKTSCSVFMSTNIHYVLQNLHVEQLLICGQLTDQCVESAVRDAADLGYFVTVIEDACAAQSHEAHLKGLSGMKGFSRYLSTAQVLDELENGRDDIVVSKRVVPTEPSDEEEMKPITTRNEPAEPKSLKHIPIITTTEWSPPSCNDKAVTTALLHTMKFAGVQFLRYMAVDACNSIRCKAVPLHHLLKTKRLDNQISIAQVCFAGLPTFGDYMSESTGLDARKVLTILPDVGSLRILPYAPTSAVVFGSAIDPISQTVSPLCTRSLLSRVVETARRYGIEFVSAGWLVRRRSFLSLAFHLHFLLLSFLECWCRD